MQNFKLSKIKQVVQDKNRLILTTQYVAQRGKKNNKKGKNEKLIILEAKNNATVELWYTKIKSLAKLK